MASWVDGIRQDIENRCDLAEAMLDGMLSTAPYLIEAAIRAVMGPTALIPGAGELIDQAVGWIMDQLRQAAGYVRDVIAWIRDLARRLGDPDSLRRIATGIDTDVSAAAIALAQSMGAGKLQAVHAENWESFARDHYRDAVQVQDEQVTALRRHGEVLSTALNESASGIEAFYNNLLIFMISVAIAVVSLCASPGPQAPVTIGLAIASIGVAIVSMTIAINDAQNTQTQQVGALQTATLDMVWVGTPFAR